MRAGAAGIDVNYLRHLLGLSSSLNLCLGSGPSLDLGSGWNFGFGISDLRNSIDLHIEHAGVSDVSKGDFDKRCMYCT